MLESYEASVLKLRKDPLAPILRMMGVDEEKKEHSANERMG